MFPYAETNPNIIQEKPLQSPCIMVWCAIGGHTTSSIHIIWRGNTHVVARDTQSALFGEGKS